MDRRITNNLKLEELLLRVDAIQTSLVCMGESTRDLYDSFQIFRAKVLLETENFEKYGQFKGALEFEDWYKKTDMELNTFLAGVKKVQAKRKVTIQKPIMNLTRALELFDLDPNTNWNEIKITYRNLVKKNHPDKLSGLELDKAFFELAQERMSDLSSAYEILKKSYFKDFSEKD